MGGRHDREDFSPDVEFSANKAENSTGKEKSSRSLAQDKSDTHGYAGYATYQPAIRYWPFQFIEAGIFAVLTALLIALAFINRRDA